MKVERLEVGVYRVPTDRPEADGTFAWEATTVLVVTAAGEYGYDSHDFRNTLVAGAVDILQADATRCLGITGLLAAAELAASFGVRFSTHTAHSIHVHLGCAAPQIDHLEYFHDHVRIERLLFDGAPEPIDGELRPDLERPGLGLELKRREAERWQAAA